MNKKLDYVNILTLSSVDSTNTFLKEKYKRRECDINTFLASDSQFAGKGRSGRKFYSPKNGLYMSLVIKPDCSPACAVNITALTAVAVCRALEKAGSEPLKIKWVNDIYDEKNKKLCGILCESVSDGNGKLECVVAGVGINLVKPLEPFPRELENVAGCVFNEEADDLKNRVAAEFINCFFELYADFGKQLYKREYTERSCVIGKRIYVTGDGSVKAGTALKINDDLSLKVQFDDNTEKDIFFGEISVKL